MYRCDSPGCQNFEERKNMRYTQEGLLCPDCFEEYINEHKEEYIEAFADNNEIGFCLIWLKAGETGGIFDDAWWVETIKAGLAKHAQLHPEDVAALKREFAECAWSDFGDFVTEQEQVKRKEGVA